MSQTYPYQGPAQFAPQQNPGGFGPGPIPPGMPGPGGQPPPAPRKSAAGKIVAIVVGALVVLAGLGVGAAVLFSTPIVDKAKVQDQITQMFSAQQIQVTTNCASDLKGKVGESVTCTATSDKGNPVQTVSTVDRVDGSTVHFTTTFTMARSTVEKVAVGWVAAQGGEADATCDGDLPIQMNASTTCTLKGKGDNADATMRVKVTVTGTDKAPKPDLSVEDAG